MTASRDRIVRLLTWTLRSFAVLLVVMIAFQIWTGAWIEYYLTLNMLVLALAPTWWDIANRLNFYGLPAELAWCGAVFIVGVLGLGLNSGEMDRRLPYSSLVDGHMVCRNQIVVSSIGKRFISVTPDNRRHLINEECKTQFDFSMSPVVPDKSLYDLAAKKFRALRETAV